MQKPSLTFAHRRLSWDQIPQISKVLAQSLQCSSKYDTISPNVVKFLLIFYLCILSTDSFSLLCPLPLTFLFSQPHPNLSLSHVPLWWWSDIVVGLWVINSGYGHGFSCWRWSDFLVLSWVIKGSCGCGN